MCYQQALPSRSQEPDPAAFSWHKRLFVPQGNLVRMAASLPHHLEGNQLKENISVFLVASCLPPTFSSQLQGTTFECVGRATPRHVAVCHADATTWNCAAHNLYAYRVPACLVPESVFTHLDYHVW